MVVLQEKKKETNVLPKTERRLYGAHVTPRGHKIRVENKSSGRNKTKNARTQCMKDYNDRLQKCVTQMYNEKAQKGRWADRSPYIPRPTHSIWASDDMFFGFTASLMMCYCRQHSVQNVKAVSAPLKKNLSSQPSCIERTSGATCNKLMPNVCTKQGAEK